MKRLNMNWSNKFFDYCLIFFCITPFWIISDLEKHRLLSLFIVLLISVFLFYFFQLSKIINKNFSFFLIASCFFYGVDSNLGLWTIFGNLFNIGIYNYLFSLLILTLIIFINYKLIQKDPDKILKIFTLIIIILFFVNLINDFSLHSKNQKIENVKINKKFSTKKNKKKIILLLDEMVGHDGIDENINYAKFAKKSYLELSEKFNLKLYSSAYSIYHDSIDSIPNLLNFDFQTNKLNSKKYYAEKILDKKTKWILKKNKLFEQNYNQKIITNKNQIMSYCTKIVKNCLVSNAINNLDIYIENFDFSQKDFFIKKIHNQRSITFQFIWRLLLEKNLINDYHYLIFNKVKFLNDLKNLNEIIDNTNYDIYFFHFIFPHKPFVFDINLKENKCFFTKKYLQNNFLRNKKQVLEQHYKEIICTNIYLDTFLKKINDNSRLKNNTQIILLSDTGLVPSKKSEDDQSSLKYRHSVFFAVQDEDKKFQIDKSFKSSQELFSFYLNDKKKNIVKDEFDNKVYSTNKKKFIKINKFD
tara:strand:- start:5794 stop:7377 length:1584 start_codon:yes stop_codon:yes gene_type:complete